jgi:threonine/homoserine/homoserine lactone efflux protein
LQAYLLHQTTHHGWRKALPGVFAPLLSDIPIIILVLVILTRFPPLVLRVLQVVGGIFVIYLAWEAYRAIRAHHSLLPAEPPAAPQTFMKAVLANGLNAGPYIFWSVIAGPMLLKVWGQSVPGAIAFLIAFHVALIGAYTVQVLFFATIRRVSSRAAYGLNIVAAIVLLLMGLYQIWSGFSGSGWSG